MAVKLYRLKKPSSLLCGRITVHFEKSVVFRRMNKVKKSQTRTAERSSSTACPLLFTMYKVSVMDSISFLFLWNKICIFTASFYLYLDTIYYSVSQTIVIKNFLKSSFSGVYTFMNSNQQKTGFVHFFHFLIDPFCSVFTNSPSD